MTVCSHETMTNHHAVGMLAQVRETLHVWRERQHARRELLRFTERDLHDVGLSQGEMLYEAEKPFWRA